MTGKIILGGAAVLGLGIFFATRKKTADTTTVTVTKPRYTTTGQEYTVKTDPTNTWGAAEGADLTNRFTTVAENTGAANFTAQPSTSFSLSAGQLS